MKTFVVITSDNNPSLVDLEAAVDRVFPDRYFRLAKGQFIAVAPELSAVQIGERLGPEGAVGQFVVFATDEHYGWHRRDLWDWLKAKTDR